MGFREYKFDVGRLWAPANDVELPACVERPEKKACRKWLKRLKRKAVQKRKNAGKLKACRELVRANARAAFETSPFGARAHIALLVQGCKRCGRCVGI